MGKVVDIAEAVGMVPDGVRLGVGGVLLQRKPMRLLAALVDAGVRDVSLLSFLASLDAEVLAASGRLAASHTGYVGFEQLGFAPAYMAAADDGTVQAHEYTEFLFVAGLRAALAGLPFMPVKGGAGSAVLEELGYAEVTCPYTGTPLVAVPALAPEVTIVHADAADEDGNVLGPADRDFLFDLDANLARASDVVIVSVEEVVPAEVVTRHRDRTLLFGFEVDAVVEAPHGAAPTAMPGHHEPDLAGIRAYLDQVRAEPGSAAAAMAALLDRHHPAGPRAGDREVSRG